MSDTSQAAKFKVSVRPRSDAAPEYAGVISIDASHMVHIVSAEAKHAALLKLAANTLNEADAFMVRTVPADAKPFSLHKAEVPRDSAEAGDAVRKLLEKDYGLLLEPAP